MQISRLIKCRGRARFPAHLNIVAYSLFLAEGRKESGEAAGIYRRKKKKGGGWEEGEEAWVLARGVGLLSSAGASSRPYLRSCMIQSQYLISSGCRCAAAKLYLLMVMLFRGTYLFI